MLSSLALSSILRRDTSCRFSSSSRVLTWWPTKSSSLLRRPFWRGGDVTPFGRESGGGAKPLLPWADTHLDVFGVGRLEFFPEVRVRLQNLDHLSQVAVVVQSCVLQGGATSGGSGFKLGPKREGSSCRVRAVVASGSCGFAHGTFAPECDGRRNQSQPKSHMEFKYLTNTVTVTYFNSKRRKLCF